MISFGAEAAFTLLGTGLQICKLWQEMLSVVCLVQLGLVGRSHSLVHDLGPVDLLEPRVRLDLLCVCRSATQSLVGVLMEQLHAQVASVVSQEVVVNFGLCILNILVELLSILGIERRETDKHLIDDCAKRPPVSCLTVALSLEHLRRQVLSCATE